MKFKQTLRPFWSRSNSVEQVVGNRRKFGFLHWGSGLQKIGLLHYLIPTLITVGIVGTVVTQVPNLRLAAFSFTKPKPITQSLTILPTAVQSAIQNLASQEIKAEAANANLAVNLSNSRAQTSQNGLIQPLIDNLQETLTQDPSGKAKINLKIIDREIAQLQNLLEKDNSDKAVGQAVKLIADIGQRTGGVVADPKVQTDREIIKLQIEQYNRLQLILQKLEDNLPIERYLKIEEARGKYLVSGAVASLNAAPNLDAVHNIAVKEVGRLVGNDFAELKAIEILSDIEGGLKPEAKVKLAGLEKELALQFEKKMLKLPRDVRERKLQNYINYSYGNPIRQIESFDRMKDFMSDREIILGLDSVKEITFKKLENRIFELNTQDQLNQFLERVLESPADLKVLTQMKLDIDSGKDQKRKQKLAQMQASVAGRISQFFGKENLPSLSQYFTPDASKSADLLDIALVSNLNDIISQSPDLPPDAKQAFRNIKTKQLASFVKNLSQKGFSTKSTAGYDPVSGSADVRILLSSPESIQLLQAIRQELSDSDKSKIDLALKAQAAILQEHILLQVNDPAIFEQYQAFIAGNPQVKQTIQSYVGQGFFTNLAQKKKLIDKQNLQDQQALYEKMQQLVQQLFVAPDGQKTDLEKQLPTEVVTEINKLKTQLPDRNVPKLTTPEGVTLPEVAKLPDDVNAAIIAAAKQEIKGKQESVQAKLDLTVKAKDLGVSEPTILPGNLLYGIVELVREIPVLLTADPVDKAEKQLSIDNERTLEAAKLLETSQSQETVDQALALLNKINQDFDLLKAHVAELKKEEPAKVDTLVDQIIENGVARQTVLSSIENKVYGDDYVKVELDRQAVLKNGVAVLLDLTNQDAQKLTEKLEQVVQNTTGSDLKDIKAVELLTEIERTQPEPVRQVLNKAEENLAQNLETKLLAMPKEQRIQEVLAYAESAPGNPILQFEAYDGLKNDFKNPETIALAEGLKDKAVENLTEKISEITDAHSRQEFVDAVVGNQPQDLKIVTEIEQRVAPPETAQVSEPLPIVEKIQDIKAEVEQNIIDTYKDKPAELVKSDFYQSATKSPDVVDIAVAQELVDVLSRSPEVVPEVVAAAKLEEAKVVDSLVAEIQSSSANTRILSPVPETVAELVKLKDETPPAVDAKIDLAIKLEVNLIEVHLTTDVIDPTTFQAYVAQIQENPVVAETVAQVGGTQFTQGLEQKAKTLEIAAVADQTKLQTTVTQLTQEIFQAPVNSPSVVEQTLPQAVQQEIVQIKQEVPVQQIPAVEVQAAVTVSAPTPAAPEVKQPETQTAPAPAAPAAPAVGL